MTRILANDYVAETAAVVSEQAEKTWEMNSRGGKDSAIEGLAALRQAVRLMLETPRYAHLVYSFDYGCELYNLLGRSNELIETEGERLIREALLNDERILSVEEFDFDFAGDEISVSFTVRSKYGDFVSEAVIA